MDLINLCANEYRLIIINCLIIIINEFVNTYVIFSRNKHLALAIQNIDL